ncbi:Cap15 family cyclic dinucleotide receptor domain-containing protein [Streptomyces broussonetiae]|uniref:CD-NTase-associated protein 15 domain-containing protein n=1 Tax=Streptomyces broussonetiae TaxID=2686304 RepID=A0ABV5EJU9_9ACTN
MKRTIIIRVVVAVVVVVFVIGTWAQDGRPDLAALKFFSVAVLASTLVFNLWDFWLWRLPLIQRVPGVPRSIRGTWKGTLTSLWVDPATGNNPPPKTVYLVAQQTASLVTVKLLTDESKSTSALASVSEVDGSFLLTYLYLNRPDMRVEHRSRIHHGSTVFDVSGNPARRLKGRYWTDRDSKGELDFEERDKKNLADDFAEAAGLFGETT